VLSLELEVGADIGVLTHESVENGPAQREHLDVSAGANRRRPFAPFEQRDLAEAVAGAKDTQGNLVAVGALFERPSPPRHDDEESVRLVALAHDRAPERVRDRDKAASDERAELGRQHRKEGQSVKCCA
jgi:hypothetical protein